MRVTITTPVVHRCPFVEEVDRGTATLEYEHSDATLIELHELRAFLAGFRTEKVTHEDLTLRVRERYPQATVTTRFTTAGCVVECRA